MMDPIFVKRGITKNARSIPLWVPWKYKWIVGPIVLLIAATTYLGSNHFQLFEPRMLPFTLLDQSIPFLPSTFWIYSSGILFFPVVYYLNRCTVSLNKHLYSFLFLVITSALIFILFPTAYPREMYPLPTDTLPITAFLANSIRFLDRPTNCAPSLHVSISFLISLGFLEDQRKYFVFIFCWAILISLSTLTTKQHYVLDVLSGLGIALFTFWLFHLSLTYRFNRRR